MAKDKPEDPKRAAAREKAARLSAEDIAALVPVLGETLDEARYKVFLVLQERSRTHPDVYPYWDTFAQKLAHQNSYQRNIGLLLLSENVRWDEAGRFREVLPRYLACCTDKKFVTCRYAVKGIAAWLPFAPALAEKTAAHLMAVPVESFSESQQKLILTDILEVLLLARTLCPMEEIEAYFDRAITGGLLDKKSAARYQNR